MIFDAKPAIVGHRGFGAGQEGGYRENSVESCMAAAASGLAFVELDVRRCGGGELVVWHDPVTPAGVRIVSLTARELAADGIVRLAEVLAALPPQVGVNIDVKTVIEDAAGPERERTHALMVEMLRSFNGTRSFFISSFDPSLPLYLREHQEETGTLPLGLITEQYFPANVAVSAAANLGLDAVVVHTGTLNLDKARLEPADLSVEQTIEAAHRCGLEVMAWSPTPEQAVRLAAAGIDAVCVNDVTGARAALAGRVFA